MVPRALRTKLSFFFSSMLDLNGPSHSQQAGPHGGPGCSPATQHKHSKLVHSIQFEQKNTAANTFNQTFIHG